MDAILALRNRLTGACYTRFSYGDYWTFSFDGFYLLSNEIVTSDDHLVFDQLRGYASDNNRLDTEDFARATVAVCLLRTEIVQIDITRQSELRLTFQSGQHIQCTTEAVVVDWYWCVNNDGRSPYEEFEVACFGPGDVQTCIR